MKPSNCAARGLGPWLIISYFRPASDHPRSQAPAQIASAANPDGWRHRTRKSKVDRLDADPPVTGLFCRLGFEDRCVAVAQVAESIDACDC